MNVAEGVDQTRPQDYHADLGDPGVRHVSTRRRPHA